MAEIDYDAWDRDAEAGLVAIDPATVTRASDDPDVGLRLLLDATGAATYEDVVHVALGRPRLDATTTSAPVWRVRTSKALDDAIKARAKEENRSVSEVLRRAAAEYLTHV